MRADYASLVKYQKAPGSPFKCNAHLAYKFPAMAIDRSDAELFDELLVQHMPNQNPNSPNRTHMALVLPRYTIVDEWDWVDLVMQRPVVALLNDSVRAALGDPDSPDRNGIPPLSLFVLDVLDPGFLQLINALAAVALDLHFVNSLQLLVTHPLRPHPDQFCGDWDPPTNEQHQRKQHVVIPFWTKHSRSLRYLWMRDVPDDVLDIVRDHATRHALDATLLANVRLLDAIRDGNGEAIKDILANARAAADQDGVRPVA
ncbi:hypothetical protein AMAG_01931 [Allomyces macrogynus ATCC 38327]|uniref:Uncharacterized protein n=1 Tax=Allomyces macrogynus (strain ATCC 38327) TaxID=578462 RepID=A0A0L0S158_ALLM3|nr:hypothetical protein AMAG_01931 [Allomyces macrogynus ATCC 38327]|eukprot:KNE56089.1 hypothetical protein AMAG_01931 [Allomyces macrogynus ATCC 38327]